MNPTLLALVGLSAVGATAWTIHDAFSSPDARRGLIYAAIALVTWLVFAYSALAVDIGVDDQGEPVTTAYEPLALLGLLGAVVVLPFVFKSTMEVIDGEF